MAKKRGVDRETLEATKRASVGQLLFRCARLLNERALDQVNQDARKQGVPVVLKPSHTALLPHLEFDRGTRLTELAKRTGVTKQAVAQVVDELESLGVVERTPDPDDSRAKLIRITPRGAEAIMHGLSILHGLERELEQRIGEQRMRHLHAALLAVQDALDERD